MQGSARADEHRAKKKERESSKDATDGRDMAEGRVRTKGFWQGSWDRRQETMLETILDLTLNSSSSEILVDKFWIRGRREICTEVSNAYPEGQIPMKYSTVTVLYSRVEGVGSTTDGHNLLTSHCNEACSGCMIGSPPESETQSLVWSPDALIIDPIPVHTAVARTSYSTCSTEPSAY